MRKITNILLISFLIALHVNAQEIKVITETTYGNPEVAARSEKQAKRKFKRLKTYPEHFDLCFMFKTSLEYNKNGKLIAQTEFKESSEIYLKIENEYTDFNKISIERTIYPLDSAANRLIKYSYNDKNNLIQVYDSSLNFIKQTDIKEIEPFTKESILKFNGRCIDKHIAKTDTALNLETSKTFDNRDSLLYITERWFDKENRLIKRIDMNSTGDSSLIQIFKYNEDGIKTYEKHVYPFDLRIVEINRNIDTISNSMLYKSAINGKLDDYCKAYYDNHKNEIKTEFYDISNNDSIKYVASSDYEYDTKCNWIEKIDYWDGEIVSVSYREITYHE